jgi:hypothetical protein
MDKLKMQTPNLADENFAALAELFPNAVTETIDGNGAVVRAIDADVLAQEINSHVASGKEERYQFTWPDKRKSVLLANAPIAATLRPCREENANFDATENLYIEGDNLIACFDSVDDELVTKIARAKPYYAVFRDSSFVSDSTLVNFEQIFKTYSPATQRRVL